jgi:hypothetical protein
VSWLRVMLTEEGSTRSSGLLRIALALLLWTRWATEVAPFFDSSPARLGLGVAFYLATTAMLLGVYSRASTAACGLIAMGMVHGFGPAGVEPWTHHHTAYLALATCLASLAPVGHSYSIDKWRAGEGLSERAPLWGLRMVGLHVSVVYFWTAWDKTFAAFLSGDRLEMAMHQLYLGSDPAPTGFSALMFAAAVLTVGLEYLLVVALWVRRWQWWSIPTGLALHAVFFILLPVGTFTATVFACYLAFLDADAVHRVLDRLGGRPLAPPMA